MNLIIRKEAEQEIIAAMQWYKQQQHGIEENLFKEITHLLSRISDQPKAFPKIRNSLRQALLRKFPYAVYYRLTKNTIVIYAFLHQQRSPNKFHHR